MRSVSAGIARSLLFALAILPITTGASRAHADEAGGPAHAGQTKSYVVSWFLPAMNSTDNDCPQGKNPNGDALLARFRKEAGLPESDGSQGNGARGDFQALRGRINGKPANAYLYPTSAPDPHIKIGEGKLGFGFNLDGKIDELSFTDPETHEQGVDNNLARVFGCFDSSRGDSATRASWPDELWDSARDTMQAWLIQISGIDDPQNDDEVEIGFYRAMAPIYRNAVADPQSNMTFVVDSSPQFLQNKVRGRIKDGVITSDVFNFSLVADPFIQPIYAFDQARVRFRIQPDGSLLGYMGGYTSVDQAYAAAASGEGGAEAMNGWDAVGIYYALHRLADGPVDLKTGKHTTISATFRFDAVPAFFQVPDQKPNQQPELASTLR